MGCVVDTLSAKNVVGEGDKEASNTRLLKRELFDMRGFGQWHVEWGVGCYGTSFTGFARIIGSDHVEDMEIHNAKCKIANRISYGALHLRFGSKRMGDEDVGNVIL